ncbi:tetratricopeptide repeat protein, partial [candidate division WOR-3 bacterium]|nr:tetratricopeptide repeat protein [candidate division WOR-3 bacterium]
MNSSLAMILMAIIGGLATLLGVAIAVYSLIQSRFVKVKLQSEIHKLKESLKEGFLYLDGLPEVSGRKKNVILYSGMKHYREYKYSKAISAFTDALMLASDDSERCAILNLIGLSQRKSGATRDAEQTFLKMIDIAEQAKLDEALSVALGNTGVVYHTLGEPHKALEYYQKSLEIAKQIGNLEVQANQLGNIGNVY